MGNDVEIVREARRTASTKVQRIALLVYDLYFIENPFIEELQGLGKEPIVILPNRGYRVRVQRLKRMEVLVLLAEEHKQVKSYVPAISRWHWKVWYQRRRLSVSGNRCRFGFPRKSSGKSTLSQAWA